MMHIVTLVTSQSAQYVIRLIMPIGYLLSSLTSLLAYAYHSCVQLLSIHYLHTQPFLHYTRSLLGTI
jgi:hypothetical protein